MRKYTTLSIIAAAVLLAVSPSVMAEEDILDENGISEEMRIEMAQDRAADEALAEQEKLAAGESEIDYTLDPSNASSGGDVGIDATGNTAYGSGAGAGATGNYNDFYGLDSGKNTAGSYNTMYGVGTSSYSTLSGAGNIFMGNYAGARSTSAEDNIFIGSGSGSFNTTGDRNTFVGDQSGFSHTTGSDNVFIGRQSGFSNKTSGANVYVGSHSGHVNNTVNGRNTFVGHYSGYANKGEYNNFFGYWAAHDNTSGDENLIMGSYAGRYNTTGHHNVFSGNYSGYKNKTGYRNVSLGNFSGYSNVDGDANIFIGYGAGYSELGNNKLYIDNSSTTKPLIYGDFASNLLKVNGTFETNWSGSDTSNFHKLATFTANNTGSGASNLGFTMADAEAGYEWSFRTYKPSEGFSATKTGTGGNEFEVGNTGTTLATTVVKMGGVVVFKNGHLVNKSGNELTSLVQEQSIKLAAQDKLLAETMAKMEAKDQKIAAIEAEIVQLKTMKQKVAMMESILTNLALDSSNAKAEKISLNSK